MRTLSGIQPSGRLHIGNYYGAIRQFLDRQERDDDMYIFVANSHALTTLTDGDAIRQNTREVAAAYLACGLDPDRITLYRQADVPEYQELAWVLACMCPIGLMERAHAFKDKTARGLVPNVGLFTYPILMAADILVMQPDVVPVGKDQKQHIEITRDLAAKFNESFGEILKLPEHEIPDSVATVPGTDGQKMSKSYGNTIDLFGTDAELKKQVMGIQTDSRALGEPLDPTTCNVFALFQLVAPAEEISTLEQDYLSGAIGYGDAKKRLLAAIHQTFDPAREAFATLMAEPEKLEKILQTGAEKARTEAQKTLAAVRQKTGLN